MSDTVADFIADQADASWISPLGIESSFEKLIGVESKGRNVADLGGGTGELGREISRRRPKARVITTDISQRATEEAKESQAHGDHHILKTDGLKGLEDDYFGQVYAVNVLQAMENPKKGLRQVSDKLEEGGTAVVTVPGEESANLFPDQAQFYDRALEIPYIEVPVSLYDNETTYSQYTFPEKWMMEAAEEVGLEIEDGYPEKMLSDPTGIPNISEICEEPYSPELPSGATYAIEKIPSDVIRKTVDYTNIGPEVDLWIMEK